MLTEISQGRTKSSLDELRWPRPIRLRRARLLRHIGSSNKLTSSKMDREDGAIDTFKAFNVVRVLEVEVERVSVVSITKFPSHAVHS
jgi:hypothetical protein